MAGAEYIDRSPVAEATTGGAQEEPPSVDHDTSVFSLFRPWRPSLHASTMALVAPWPVGAPLAMSTLGAADRSIRAPAKPSITHRPSTGSTKKHGSVMATVSCSLVQCTPPSNDLNIACAGAGPPKRVRNRYTTPWLSVLIVQPSRNPNFRNELPPPELPGICRWTHVVPPSAEDATMIGTGVLG